MIIWTDTSAATAATNAPMALASAIVFGPEPVLETVGLEDSSSQIEAERAVQDRGEKRSQGIDLLDICSGHHGCNEKPAQRTHDGESDPFHDLGKAVEVVTDRCCRICSICHDRTLSSSVDEPNRLLVGLCKTEPWSRKKSCTSIGRLNARLFIPVARFDSAADDPTICWIRNRGFDLKRK
jgi:hypothetical protein